MPRTLGLRPDRSCAAALLWLAVLAHGCAIAPLRSRPALCCPPIDPAVFFFSIAAAGPQKAANSPMLPVDDQLLVISVTQAATGTTIRRGGRSAGRQSYGCCRGRGTRRMETRARRHTITTPHAASARRRVNQRSIAEASAAATAALAASAAAQQ